MFYAKSLLRLSVWFSRLSKFAPEFAKKRLDRLAVRLAYRAVSGSGHGVCKCKGCSRS
jgi:hypothetical protein